METSNQCQHLWHHYLVRNDKYTIRIMQCAKCGKRNGRT